MRRLTTIALSVILGTSATAQMAEQSKCWLGSLSFSPGATAHTGAGISLCSLDFTWIPADAKASGCIAGDEFYGVGAIENGPRSGSVKMECTDLGTWQRLSE